MLPMKTLRPRLLILAILAALATATSASASAQSLIGTWETVSTLDGSGKVSRILDTYDRHGTWLLTGPTAFAGTGHGVWEKTGARSYSTMAIIPGYDPQTGDLAFTLNVRAELELSADGTGHEGAFEVEIRDLDGNVLLVNTGTLTSTRLTVGGRKRPPETARRE